MKIEHVYIASSPQDLRYTRCCVASVRRWYPDVPISLVKDETNGPYSTRELEDAWGVSTFAPARRMPGRTWGKLEPLLLPDPHRFLLLDSDIVLLGRVIEPLEAVDADFVVESNGGWAGLIGRDYFDLAALREFDPGFVFPGYTFNTGQLLGTSGILQRSDFEALVRFGELPERIRPDIFGEGEQGVLNYVLMKKAQQGELSLARLNFMLWGGNTIPRRGLTMVRTSALTADSPYPYLVHWAGRKHKLFFLMRNGRLLRHFEGAYYSRVRGGRGKRLWRSALLLWRILTRREPAHIRWNARRSPGGHVGDGSSKTSAWPRH